MVDPLADKFPSWTPYHYVHNNQIRLIDLTGMEAAEFPPVGLDASITSYCDSDGCFNRKTASEAWIWTDNNSKAMGYASSEMEVVTTILRNKNTEN